MEQRQLGGIGFLIGNTALFANGLIANRFANTPESRKAGAGRMASSAMWGASGLFLAKYGDRPAHAQQARLEEKLAEFLKESGVPLDAATLHKADEHTRHGWFKKVEDFFYAHPIECTNAYYALAATGFAVSGALRHKDGNIKAGNANLGVSALILSGALASIIIPEKTPEQIEAKGQTGTLWGNIQKHPLGYVRWLFLGADAMAGLEAVGEYQAAKKLPHGDAYRPWQFSMAGLSVVAMVTTLISDWLTSGSKKAGGTPEQRSAAQQHMIDEAANHLAKLPPAEREALAHKVAAYLSHQPELRFNDILPQKLEATLLKEANQFAEPPGKPAKEVLGEHTRHVVQAAPSVGQSRANDSF
jgi:hypothetical protein